MSPTPTRAAVSIRTAGDMYDLSPDTIRAAINKGRLPAKRVGRSIRVDVAALAEWFRSLEDARDAT